MPLGGLVQNDEPKTAQHSWRHVPYNEYIVYKEEQVPARAFIYLFIHTILIRLLPKTIVLYYHEVIVSYSTMPV